MWMQDCVACQAAKADGLHAWMRHLTDQHVLPTEWPSARAVKLTGALALRPYTTITESKKKRRKDSIPRPLNSFMLFAQHVRRNVLRVFSDASNSVISQQLGDLWRTVPHEYRNQYDEEANRLVKIHQLEFPNYKYQPKKRQPVHNGGCGNSAGVGNSISGSGKNTQHDVTNVNAVDTCRPAGGIRMVAEYSKSFNRSPVGVSAGDYRYSGDRTPPHGSASFRPRISSVGTSSSSSVPHPSFGYRSGTTIDTTEVADTKTNDSTLRVISPAKQVAKIVTHNRLEAKFSTVNSATSFRSTAAGLSSVLPPLLAPPSRAVTVINADLFSQNHHNQGSCDSAYASEVNSSSSSSASSPAVGDLLSPIKPGCGVSTGAKSSPIRRKIQFVPIRPQSQQLYPSVTQPTRQRFLSATSGSCNIALNGGSFSDQQVVILETACSEQILDSVQISDMETHHVHRLATPVYLRLGPETNGYSEEVLLALPPGTTIIQTVGDVTHLTIPGSLGPQQQTSHRRILRTHTTKPLSTATTRLNQTLQPVKMVHRTNGHEEPYTVMANSAEYSPAPYSSGSSPSSGWSPLSGDVFLPLPHIKNAITEPGIRCKPEDAPSFYSTYPKTEDTAFLREPSDPSSDFGGLEATNQFEMDIGQPITEFRQHDGLDYLECNVHQVTTANDGNSFAVWASPPVDRIIEEVHEATRQDRVFASTACTTPMTPLAVEIVHPYPTMAQTETKQPDNLPNQNADDTDFSMANEENFDSSFDAMMSSIDITTFLPGTFTENDDSMDDYDPQNSESEPGEYFGDSVVQRRQLTDTEYSTCVPHERPSSEVVPLIDIDDMLNSLDHCPQITHRKETTATVTYFADQLSYSIYADKADMVDELKSSDMHRLINNSAGNTGCTQHSPLSDLDSLDKSSLFVIKPDWSLRVCE